MNNQVGGECPLKALLISCQSCTLTDPLEISSCAAETSIQYSNTFLELANRYYQQQISRAFCESKQSPAEL